MRRMLWMVLLFALLPWAPEHGSVVRLGEIAPVSASPVATPLQEVISDHRSGRIWNAYNQSQNAAGPAILSTPVVVQAGPGLFHLYVRAANGDLVEYVNDDLNGRIWNAYDLSAAAGGGGPIGGTPAAVYLPGQGLLHLYMRAANGDLVEYVNDNLNGRIWNAYDLSADAGGGGPIGGTPAAYLQGQGLLHLYMRAANGDLVEYVNDDLNGRIWNAYDLSLDAGGGTFVAGNPAAVYLPGQGLLHLYVRAANNDLVEYVNDSLNGRIWNAYDLSAATQGPTVGTDPSAVESGGVVHVFVGGPVPMGGSVIWNAFDVPDAPYLPGDRVVALTFDDGPSPIYTPQILRILEAYRVPASFQIVGSQGAAYPNLIQQETSGGFALVNHTWGHARLTTLSPAGWVGEVDRTDNLIASVTHRSVACLRPPYGATDAAVVSQLAQRGLGELMWDVDPSDYLNPGASVIVQRVLGSLHPGAIIGLHDGGGDRSQTVQALPAIINGIRAAGYAVVEVCG